MKSNTSRIALMFVAFAVSSVASSQAQPCSNGSFNGSFGFTNSGTIVGVGDFAAVVLATLVLCLVAALYPAWRASRLDPVDAIRKQA